MPSANYNKVLAMFDNLSLSEKDDIIQEIMNKLGAVITKKTSGSHCGELVAEAKPQKPDCPHCGAKAEFGYIIKKGIHKGAQRYMCKQCGRKFVSTTNTAYSRTKKDADTWRRFIAMTIDRRSLQDCAYECGIAYQTAFNWRHKILNAFSVNQEATKMTGDVEIDEMLIPLSYKGNHIKGGFGARRRLPGMSNGLPRRSFRRGSDNKSTSAKDKSCVFCMVEDGNKHFYAAVPGTGFMTNPMLDATVKKHVDKEKALLLADNYRITRRYLQDNGYAHMILAANTSNNPKNHRPQIVGTRHLQHVNAMHRHLRDFLRPYSGVSSKYLSNYVSMFVWLKSIKVMKQKKSADKISVARAAAQDAYITVQKLHSRPAVPRCA